MFKIYAGGVVLGWAVTFFWAGRGDFVFFFYGNELRAGKGKVRT